MTVSQYLDKVNQRYKTGISTEHSYRGDLQTLLETLAPDVMVTNEPSRISCGAPDYIITKREIPVGYVEAKDIGLDLNSKSLKEQFDRYKASLNNLIITDYLDFHLFIDGTFATSVRIGRIEGNKVLPITEHFEQFENLIKDFCRHTGQTIKSAKKLAEMMAGKAKMLAIVIENALDADEQQLASNNFFEEANNTLRDQLKAFRDILIHDITNKDFADIYAQTIAYGMFAARLHDPDLKTFSRAEAAEQIPKTNPFLRKLFQYIAGYDLDNRIKWIVDALADIFRATDVRALVSSFGQATKQTDPIIHFYETFLSEYDPKLKKARGVWYTPEPVVNFIVRAVDDILKTEFDLPQGLADNSKIKIKVDVQGKKVEQEVHKVQILDPATGTGTFLAEVIKQINTKFEGQQGIWSNYVENHLVPRLNGFELLMASYAMAHLKLDLLLTETGFKPTKEQRFRVYLTNSLEEYHPETGTLFANWLSAEANEANRIKRDTPVMCVIGNPPYSVNSSNKSEWIENLTSDYKRDLDEKNIQPLSDDYIKFIRFGQYFVDKNGCGILAYISNNSFIDGIIHRQMRKYLLESFDKIYILDLHGNAKRKEVSPDGTIDRNVFDIMQGVSINIFVKKGAKRKNEMAQVYNFDLQGTRELKYDFLYQNSLKSIKWDLLNSNSPNYFFVNKNFDGNIEYQKYFDVSQLFVENSVGVVTSCDDKILAENNTELKLKILANFEGEKYDEKKVMNYLYRPFDIKKIYYESKFLGRSREKIMQHYKSSNVGLIVSKQFGGHKQFIVFITSMINDKSSQPFAPYYNYPLYLYSKINTQLDIEQSPTRTPNLNLQPLKIFSEKIKLIFTNEKEDTKDKFAPIDILEYIYAVLNNPTYRKKYKEFLKIDFPRIPYPENAEQFWKYVAYGKQLRELHLMESPLMNKLITTYPVNGSNEVEKIKYVEDKVYINEEQYFAGVTLIAWEFYIGGYQPAQKWLKDRKGRALTFDDILHYQKIIVALTETDRLMKEIEKFGTI